METLAQIETEVDNITDKLGKPIDKKIKHLVIALKMNGFPTSGSCEGHLSRGFAYPWVEINFIEDSYDKAEIEGNKNLRRKIRRLLEQFYKTTESEHPILLQRIGIYGAFRLQNVSWNQDKTPKPKHDTKTLLKEYRQEMDAFADFLLSKK